MSPQFFFLCMCMIRYIDNLAGLGLGLPAPSYNNPIDRRSSAQKN